MADYRCPQCMNAIRGASMFRAQRTNEPGGLPSGSVRCPQRNSQLNDLTNWWAIAGYAMALISIPTRMLIDTTAHPALSLGLGVASLAGFSWAVIAINYLPRYGMAMRPASDMSQR